MYLYKIFKKYIKSYREIDDFLIDYETAKRILNEDGHALLIDVRSKQEYNEGHLDGSINISLYDFKRGNFKITNKNTTIILYCEMGKRSKKALQILKRMGYKNVYYLDGGLEII